MTEILCAGMAVADFVFRVPEIPSRAEKYRAHSLETVVGGQAANAAIAIARLGARAVLVTRLGEAAIADSVRSALEAEGVECRIRRRGRSAVSAAMIDAAGERQIVNFPGEALGKGLGERLAEGLAEGLAEALAEAPGALDGIIPAAVLVDVHWPEAALAGLGLARSAGVPGIVDAEKPAPGAVLEAATHVAFSRSGLATFTGIGDKQSALAAAADRLNAWVCVTDGAAGVSHMSGDDARTIPAFPVRAVDTLGAGDVWHGAFALRLAEGADETTAVRFANAAAALKCAGAGGGRAAPDRNAVETLLEDHE